MHDAVGAMHPDARLIELLYQSLKAGDARAAAECYTDEAFFEDIPSAGREGTQHRM